MAAAPEQLSSRAGMEAKGDEVAAVNTEASAAPAAEAGQDSSSNGQDDAEQGTSLQKIKTNFGDRPECFKNTFQEVSELHFVFETE